MPFQLQTPFYAFRLKFASGGNLLSPLNDTNVLRLQMHIQSMAAEYSTVFTKAVLQGGQYMTLLNEMQEGEYYKSFLSLPFNASKDGFRYPDFELEYDYFYKKTEYGFFGIVPSLAIESFAPNMERLEESLKHTILLDFTKNRRLSDVRQVVSAIWFELSELEVAEMTLTIPTLSELDNQSELNQESLLARVATPLNLPQQVLYGRDKELDQLLNTLKSNFMPNVLLVGPSGVGKTTLVWELSRVLQENNIKSKIWETTASVLIKEMSGETGWQDQVSELCRELGRTDDILFIRNLMELFEVGQYEGNDTSMADYMRPYISRGEVHLISECSEEELARIELRAPQYLSLFQQIRIEEPKEELEDIIIKKVSDLALQRRVTIDTEAIRETIRLNRRFTPYAGFPGKPIRFLEGVLINNYSVSPTSGNEKQTVGRSEVIRSFCEETGLPRFMVDPEMPMDTAAVVGFFKSRLFGQQQAIESLVGLLAAVKTALTRTGKPIASFLFVGPSGVGKTELAKLLSTFMFGDPKKMTRFDMSEYADHYAILRLTGNSYFSEGLLSSAVRQEPFSVLLFDEIEKAHPSFNDLLLQVLSEGRLTDSRGRLVNFCSTIIIMTSNIGAAKQMEGPIGFQEGGNAEIVAHYLKAVQKEFRPELFNRIDQVIPFEPLSKQMIREVVEREISLLKEREGIRFRMLDLKIDEPVLDFLGEKGFNKKYGARYLQRTIQTLLINPLARQLNQQDFDAHLFVTISVKEGAVQIAIESNQLGIDLLLEKLEKISQADYISELRRNLVRLLEGAAFLNLLNRLDLLERGKKKDEAGFWENKKKAADYSKCLHIRQNIDSLQIWIEKLEEDMSLVCLEMLPYETDISVAIEKWKSEFLAAKLELYQQLHPVNDQCYLSIYGREIEDFYNFYKKMLLQKEFSWTMEAIWFREQFFNEDIIIKEVRTDERGKPYTNEVRKKRHEYIKTAIDPYAKIFEPERPADVLFGLELKVNGTAASLYLEDEEGLMQWKTSEQKMQSFVIHVSEDENETPSNINRRDFYKGTPRRIIASNYLKDTRLRIDREVAKNAHLNYLLPAMDDRFMQRLDQELLGG